MPPGEVSSVRVRVAVARILRWIALAAPGCASPGDVVVTVAGSAEVREGIAPTTAARSGFDDGWSLRISRAQVNVGGVSLRDADGTERSVPGFTVVDLARAALPVATSTLRDVAPGRWRSVSYEVTPADRRSVAGNVSPDELAAMRSQGLSLYLEAVATHPTRGTRALRWGFTDATRYVDCRDRNGQAGLVVRVAAASPLRLTLRLEHIFYDDLQSPDARLRFDAIADADADADGAVTLDELDRVDLTALPRSRYGAGSDGSVRTLRDFISASTVTLGHFDGDGTCAPRPIERTH